MKYLLLIAFLNLCHSFQSIGQTNSMKSLSELINTQDPGWKVIETMINEAKNKVVVLPKNPALADSALLASRGLSPDRPQKNDKIIVACQGTDHGFKHFCSPIIWKQYISA